MSATENMRTILTILETRQNSGFTPDDAVNLLGFLASSEDEQFLIKIKTALNPILGDPNIEHPYMSDPGDPKRLEAVRLYYDFNTSKGNIISVIRNTGCDMEKISVIITKDSQVNVNVIF